MYENFNFGIYKPVDFPSFRTGHVPLLKGGAVIFNACRIAKNPDLQKNYPPTKCIFS
jgi:hypothetical protein